MLGRNFDGYYDPPEEPETPICEDCGQDMEDLPVSKKLHSDEHNFSCINPYCPAKFEGEAKEMAQALADALDTVSRLEYKVRFLQRHVTDAPDPDLE